MTTACNVNLNEDIFPRSSVEYLRESPRRQAGGRRCPFSCCSFGTSSSKEEDLTWQSGFARQLAVIPQTLQHHYHSGHHHHHHHHHHRHLIHPSWAIASLTISTSSSTAPLATWSRSIVFSKLIISIIVLILALNCERKQISFTVLKPQSKILTFAKTCTAVFLAISWSHQLSSRCSNFSPNTEALSSCFEIVLPLATQSTVATLR